MEEMHKNEEDFEEHKETESSDKNNDFKEVKVEERKEERRNGNGKIVAYVAVVIAVVALVLSLANLGTRGTVKNLQKKTELVAQKEGILEVKTMQIDLLSDLDRIYVLTLVEHNYDKAAKELEKAMDLFNRIKGTLDENEAKRVQSLFASLKAEIEKGPSPIPEIISEIRSSIAGISVKPVSEVKPPEAKKEVAVVKRRKAPQEVVQKKAPEQVKEEQVQEKPSSLKKFYDFWSSLGKKLVKK